MKILIITVLLGFFTCYAQTELTYLLSDYVEVYKQCEYIAANIYYAQQPRQSLLREQIDFAINDHLMNVNTNAARALARHVHFGLVRF